MDDLLDDTALRDMKQQFWRRYKTRFPPELYPSDATLSRVTRELNKRMLCVFSVWKVKSLQFQLVSTSKKRKLGENLFTDNQELEEVLHRDWESYLDRLQILLTAYALAGVPSCCWCPPRKLCKHSGRRYHSVRAGSFGRGDGVLLPSQALGLAAWLQHRH